MGRTQSQTTHVYACSSVWKVTNKNSMIWSFFTKFTDQLHVNTPFPVSLFFRLSSLSFFLFSSSAASSASLSARRASRSFLRASLLLAASSYEEVLSMNYLLLDFTSKKMKSWCDDGLRKTVGMCLRKIMLKTSKHCVPRESYMYSCKSLAQECNTMTLAKTHKRPVTSIQRLHLNNMYYRFILWWTCSSKAGLIEIFVWPE